MEQLKEFQKKIGYQFQQEGLLRQGTFLRRWYPDDTSLQVFDMLFLSPWRLHFLQRRVIHNNPVLLPYKSPSISYCIYDM